MKFQSSLLFCSQQKNATKPATTEPEQRMIRCPWLKRLSIYGVMFLAMILMGAGCSRGGLNRASVSGTVTVDGKPVPFGNVNFYAKPGTNCPTLGAAIKDGLYKIEKKDGPVPGEYTVKIIANTATPGKVKNLRGQEEDGMITKSILPKKYNPQQGGKETISAEIKEGKNTIDFNLTN